MQIGTVFLRVADLDRQTAFYRDVLGFQEQRRTEGSVFLGAGGEDLLALMAAPAGKRYPDATGLYHFAVLLPSRADLARFLRRMDETRTPLQGASNHIVSEAIYLADPEGNGIEVYADRPREVWQRGGTLQMATLPLDVESLLGELRGSQGTWQGMPPGTAIGHIHLQVASIPDAERFYHDLLGFDIMFHFDSATFLAYDGYHHHIGANTWGGRVPPPPDALGLDHFVLRVSDPDRLAAILDHLRQADYPHEQRDGGWWVRDPSSNALLLTGRAIA